MTVASARAAIPAAARAERGFTLLELGLVLALIGLLAALVVPRLGLLTSAALDTSTRRLATRLQYLREDAARRGRFIAWWSIRAAMPTAPTSSPTPSGRIVATQPAVPCRPLPSEFRLTSLASRAPPRSADVRVRAEAAGLRLDQRHNRAHAVGRRRDAALVVEGAVIRRR
jgi:prepilin-type N-terminal cleavage/methylation domain-containing protein